MFPQVHALPCAQVATPIAYREVHIGVRDDAAYMRRHIVGPFLCMCVRRIAVRGDARHEGLEVSHNGRIGILTKHQRRTRVSNEDIAHANTGAGIANRGLDVGGQVVSASTLCRYMDFPLRGHSIRLAT